MSLESLTVGQTIYVIKNQLMLEDFSKVVLDKDYFFEIMEFKIVEISERTVRISSPNSQYAYDFAIHNLNRHSYLTIRGEIYGAYTTFLQAEKDLMDFVESILEQIKEGLIHWKRQILELEEFQSSLRSKKSKLIPLLEQALKDDSLSNYDDYDGTHLSLNLESNRYVDGNGKSKNLSAILEPMYYKEGSYDNGLFDFYDIHGSYLFELESNTKEFYDEYHTRRNAQSYTIFTSKTTGCISDLINSQHAPSASEEMMKKLIPIAEEICLKHFATLQEVIVEQTEILRRLEERSLYSSMTILN